MTYKPDSYPRNIPAFKITGRGEVTVSAKGIITGNSDIPNDGADFGPDTMLGATAPGQYGPSYTQTSGIQEAINYAYQTPLRVILNGGIYIINSGILIPQYGINIGGQGWISDNNGNSIAETTGTIITPSVTNTEPLLAFANSTVPNVNLNLHDIGFLSNQSAYNGNTLINLAQNEVGGTNIVLEKCWFNGYSPGASPNSSIFNFNGNEDAYIKNCRFEYISSNINIPYGNINVSDCIFDASTTAITFEAQIVNLTNTTLRIFTFYGSSLNHINFTNCYWNPSNGSPIQVNALNTSAYITLTNCLITAGETGNVQGVFGIATGTTLYVKAKNTVFYSGSGSTINQINTAGLYFDFDDQCTFENGMPMPIKTLPTASISTNPPVSGAVYQNTLPFDIEIDLPVYATTAGTAGYVTIAKGASSTPTSIGNQFVNGSTSSTSTDIIKLSVPAGWYYSFTASGITFETASVFPD